MRFSLPVEKFIDDFSDALEVDRTTFLEHLVIDLMAHLEVSEEIGGPAYLNMFSKADGELLRGRELFDWLVEFYRGQLGDVEEPDKR